MWMIKPSLFRRILNTSVFRLSLLYAVLFSLIAAVALISVYKVAETQIQRQVDTRLQLQTNLLQKIYQNFAVEGLIEAVNIYNQKGDRPFFFYLLIHRVRFDLTRFVEADRIVKDKNQWFSSRPLGDMAKYIDGHNKEDEVRVLLTVLPGGYQLLVGAELKETKNLLNQLFRATLIAISVIFTVSFIIGFLMARNMVKRIKSVTSTADNIIEGDLSQRIPVIKDRNNEFDRLGLSLNRMLDRNEELMQSMQQVTNNLAHDLRNPLNRIRNRLESVQSQKITEQDFLEVTDNTIHDIDGVISTFNALLSIAQIESGMSRKKWETFSLNTLLDDLSEVYEAVADEQEKIWQYEIDENLELHGCKQLLAQLLANLLDNAFKYTPEDGVIKLSASMNEQSNVQISIADNGSGIPEEQYRKVLKRFHRLDSARSTEGNGLGLSLVKAVADLHDAKIEFSDNQPGLVVTVVFSKHRRVDEKMG